MEDILKLKELLEQRKSFRDHKGRPGKVGGSLPRGQGNVKAPKRIMPPTIIPSLAGGMIPTGAYLDAKDRAKVVHDKAILNMVRAGKFRYMSPEEHAVLDTKIRSTIERNLRDLLADKPISIRGGEATVDKIIADGRFKSQFETGTSGGYFEPNIRLEVEEENGVPWETSKELRPIYGFIKTGTSYDNSSDQYGRVEYILKKSVRERTSFVIGDTINDQGDVVASPVDDPSILSIQSRYQLRRVYDRNYDGLRTYVEAQVHFGVKLSDVERVVYHGPAGLYSKTDDCIEYVNSLKDKFEKLGIAFEHVKDKIRKVWG
jgi:hypothetical protein